MFLIGFLVLLQASDLNPLLTIKNYGVWVNGHFPLGTNFFLTWFIPCLLIGGTICGIGLNIMKPAQKN